MDHVITDLVASSILALLMQLVNFVVVVIVVVVVFVIVDCGIGSVVWSR